jgi:hypothetical protein
VRRPLAALAAVAVVAMAPVPARAADPVVLDGSLLCSFASINDPTGTRQAGYINGGPVLFGDDDAADNPVYGSVTCAIHVGYQNLAHSAPDATSATSPVTPGAAVLAPTLMSYDLPNEWDLISYCTQVDIVGGPTYYWDEYSEAWSTDPDSACEYLYDDPPPPDFNIVDYILELANELVFIPIVDPVLCPVLAALPVTREPNDVLYITVEGDTYVAGSLFWDCPPYELT